MKVGYRVAFAIFALMVFTAGMAYGDVNLFAWNTITIDPTYTNAVIAPFGPVSSPPYIPPDGATYNDGFPLGNMFGLDEQTAEGTYDTIFAGSSYDNSGPYDNVYFHVTDGLPVSHIGELIVDGAQDSGTDTNRAFTSFALWTYTDVTNTNTYTLLYQGTPQVDASGGEHIAADVNLNNVGPYFVIQFSEPSSAAGARVFDVVAAVPEPVGFLAFFPVAVLGACGASRRWRRRRS